MPSESDAASFLLHVGYYKTATTFLQSEVFTRDLGVLSLGKPTDEAWPGVLAQQIVNAPSGAFDVETWRAQVRRSVEDWSATFERRPEKLVFSNETLSTPEAFQGADATLAPQRLAEVFGDDAQILITIREQSALVESLYLHNAKPSRATSPTAWLRENEQEVAGLDYDARFDCFAAVFGAENVFVLPQEMLRMNAPSAASRLARLLNIEDDAVLQRLRERPARNTRRSRRELMFNRVRARIAPETPLGHILPDPVRRKLRGFVRGGAPAEDVFSDSIRAHLRNRFRHSNAALARKTALPLGFFGYTL